MGKLQNKSLMYDAYPVANCMTLGKTVNFSELLVPHRSPGDIIQAHHTYNLLMKKTINTPTQLRDHYSFSELPSSVPLLFIKVLRIQCDKDMHPVCLHGQHLPFWILRILTANKKQ